VKVVLDTNVLVSGVLSPFGQPGEVIRMIVAGSLSLLYDARIMTEYAHVLKRPKFSLNPEHVEALLDHVKAEGVIVASDPLFVRLPDKEDEAFLEVALAGHAQCLITGNLKHFPAAARQGMRILSPAEFLDLYRQSAKTKTRPR
jgi:putative PIN family toxin of toxin-antitoxin system